MCHIDAYIRHDFFEIERPHKGICGGKEELTSDGVGAAIRLCLTCDAQHLRDLASKKQGT